MSALARGAVALALTAPLIAAAADHRGSLGVALSAGAAADSPFASTALTGAAPRVELLATAAVFSDDNELFLGAAALTSGALVEALGGVRIYFGRDEWKTFSDVGITLHLHDALALGPRLALGVQWDPFSLFGLFAAAHAQLGFGASPRAGAGISLGVQGRSYLLQ